MAPLEGQRQEHVGKNSFWDSCVSVVDSFVESYWRTKYLELKVKKKNFLFVRVLVSLAMD